MSKRSLDLNFDGLSASQATALKAFEDRKNIFVTGGAGTGKSHLIRCIADVCKARELNCGINATTGIAAVHIGGRTIHSFLSIFPHESHLTKEELATRNSKEKKYKWMISTLKRLDVLVVDEVSMLDEDLLEKADWVCKVARSNGAPFGGIQLVLCGDFFQLPPVKSKKLLFESPLFYEVVQERHVLEQVFRQKESEFLTLLANMRRGQLTPEQEKVLESRLNADVSVLGIKPTRLFSKNLDVDAINAAELAKLEAATHTFVVRSGSHSLPGCEASKDEREKAVEKLLKDHLQTADRTVDLKEGAQVMLTYNLDTTNGLCNGSRGVVVAFKEPTKPDAESIFAAPNPKEPYAYPKALLAVVRFMCNDKPVEIQVPFVRYSRFDKKAKLETYAWCVPLKLAWATTIHKSQGLSMDCLEVALDASVFEYGQAYVAVSRARSLAGLSLSAWDPRVVRANPLAVEFESMPWALLKLKYGGATGPKGPKAGAGSGAAT